MAAAHLKYTYALSDDYSKYQITKTNVVTYNKKDYYEYKHNYTQD